MYNVDSGASLHMMRESSLSAGKETLGHTKKQLGNHKREWTRPFHKRCEGLHPVGRHSLRREVGGRIAFGFVSWTIVW